MTIEEKVMNLKYNKMLKLIAALIVIVFISSCNYINEYNKKVESIENSYSESNNYGYDIVFRKKIKDWKNYDSTKQDYLLVDVEESIATKIHCEYKGRSHRLIVFECDMYNLNDEALKSTEYEVYDDKEHKLTKKLYKEIGYYLFEARRGFALNGKTHYSKRLGSSE